MVTLSITTNPKYGTATISGSGESYTITYKYTNATNALFDRFEYQVTDKYGAKSKSTITVYFDGNLTYTSVIPYSNLNEPATSCSDYELVCKFHFSVTAGLTKEIDENNEYKYKGTYGVPIALYYIHPGKRLSAEDLIGQSAEYRTDLDPIDELGNRIPQWISIDKTVQDTLVANFIGVGEQTCPLATDRNMFLPDVGGSVTSVVANVQVYTCEYANNHVSYTEKMEYHPVCWPTVTPGCPCDNTNYNPQVDTIDDCVSVLKYNQGNHKGNDQHDIILSTGAGYSGSFLHTYTNSNGVHTITQTISLPSYIFNTHIYDDEPEVGHPILSTVTYGNSTLIEFFIVKSLTVNYDNGEQKTVTISANGHDTGYVIE